MSEIERFMQDVQKNPALLEEFKTIGNDMDKAVSLANRKGYHFTREEAEQLSSSGELSDAQLERVAGGWSLGCDGNTINPTIGCPAKAVDSVS